MFPPAASPPAGRARRRAEGAKVARSGRGPARWRTRRARPAPTPPEATGACGEMQRRAETGIGRDAGRDPSHGRQREVLPVGALQHPERGQHGGRKGVDETGDRRPQNAGGPSHARHHKARDHTAGEHEMPAGPDRSATKASTPPVAAKPTKALWATKPALCSRAMKKNRARRSSGRSSPRSP